MRLESALFRAIGVFALLGLLLFGGRTRAPERPPAAVRVAAIAPPRAHDTIAISTVSIDKGDAALAAERENVPPVPLEPVPGTRVRESEPIAELAPLPRALTPGRRAALRAILEGDAYLLYFGDPLRGDSADPENSNVTLIEMGVQDIPTLRHESVGDSVDPMLEEFVRDFNLQIRHAQKSGLIQSRTLDGVWRAAARLDADADEILLDLLDDPTDAIATAYDPETGACELDLGQRDGIAKGMRFVLWTQGRPLRRVLALAEVYGVSNTRCRVRIVKKLRDSWPAAPGIRASNPFFCRGRRVAGIILGQKDASTTTRLERFPRASLYKDLAFPEFCIVGDVRSLAEPTTRAGIDARAREWSAVVRDSAANKTSKELSLERARRAGAILVPERLVPYLLPPR